MSAAPQCSTTHTFVWIRGLKLNLTGAAGELSENTEKNIRSVALN